jgi:hypothetical protein
MFGDLKLRPRCNSKVPRTLGAQFSFLNLKFRTHINRFWFIKQKRLNLDVWWFNNSVLVELRGPPRLGTPIPPSNSQILNNLKEIFIQIEFILILDIWWFNNPTPVELRGPVHLGTPIPPSNPRISNTHNQIFIQIEFILILDVWWFNNPALVELRGPPCLGTPIPPSSPRIFKYPQTNYHPKRIYTNFRCWVIWKLVHTSSARNPNSCLKKYNYKEKWTK